ncbi:autotransporter-associated beta strand repeat-containing protein [Luteolibacter yonseiensis]|uniref:Autotransporter-associated beta strand repeat-containing protein n=1 Tax=Luteolibacter yonseiensis TaxID=1144680 RepID=A0A934VCJ5_9BACT|nr:autotransporter-associated beta strand repeat-containing protein [Luteolibacter yonseiensis]MBK1818408.1 autotransporter-associated beta strand repeat-containing protein [Luteolibacter yonseiensis]
MKPNKNLFKRVSSSTLVSSLAVISVAGMPLVRAANNIWSDSGTTDWNTATNWSLGRVPEKATFGDEVVINTNTGSIATISADISLTPSGIIVGNGASTNGRLDQTAGIAATGGGNWMKIGHNGGTGVYNLANTAATGGTLTGYGQGTGSMTVNGHLRVGGGDNGSGGNGTANINTSGTLAVTSEFHVGTNSSTGVFNLDSGTVNIGNATVIGNGSAGGNLVTGTLNMSGGTLNKATGNQFRIGQSAGNGFLNISGGTLNNNGTSEFQIGDGAGSHGTVTLSASGAINTNSWLSIGRSTGTGVLNVNGGTLTKTNGGTAFIVGDGSTGTLNQTAGAIATNGEFWIGSGTSNGNYNMSGGTLSADSWFVVGRNANGVGKLTMTGGTITKAGSGDFVVGGDSTSNGTVLLSGGLINVTGGITNIGKNNTATGTLTISGTGDFRTSRLVVGVGTGTGTVNLNGGTIRTTELSGAAGTATANFNGGVLQATGDSATFIAGFDTAEILSGGAKIDTQNFTLTASQSFTGSGSFTKSGSGTLALTGNSSTYTGATAVTAGTLLVNGSLASSNVTVSSDAKIGGSEGTVGGLVVNSGAIVAPGNSIGKLTAASATISGTLQVEYDGTGTGTVDLLAVLGSLDITNATLDLSQLGEAANDGAYVFASYGSLVGAAFAGITGIIPSGYHIDYAYNNGVNTNNIALVIPEPATALLGGLGLFALLRRRRN